MKQYYKGFNDKFAKIVIYEVIDMIQDDYGIETELVLEYKNDIKRDLIGNYEVRRKVYPSKLKLIIAETKDDKKNLKISPRTKKFQRLCYRYICRYYPEELL